jgi:hypothetical protein
VNTPLDVKENDGHGLDFALDLSCLFRASLNRACHSNTHVWLVLSFPNACLIIVRVSFALFPRLAQNFMLLLCPIHRKIPSSQIHDSKSKKSACPPMLHEILYTDSQDMLVLSPTVASRYCDCCTDGRTSSRKYGLTCKRKM